MKLIILMNILNQKPRIKKKKMYELFSSTKCTTKIKINFLS